MKRLITVFLLLSLNVHSDFSYDPLVHALGSIEDYLSQESSKEKANYISFSQEDVELLLQKASENIFLIPEGQDEFVEITDDLRLARIIKETGDDAGAKQIYKRAQKRAARLLKQTIARESRRRPFTSNIEENEEFERNPFIPSFAKNRMRPYLIASNHPLKSALDDIFKRRRVTTNLEMVKNADFEILAKGPRSQIFVAFHPSLPDHLLKFHLDNNLIKKRGLESWEWLVKRCEGAEKVHQIIEERNVKHFVCAKKMLYPLPAHPSPPKDKHHTRHLAALLVTDMHLVKESDNLYAWSHEITKEHLIELYAIISRAKGSSYRPDNINYTKEKQFAFIDTEYPNSSPDYYRIRKYLNREMREFWDRLVKRGGEH